MIPVFKPHSLTESLSRIEGAINSGWISANGQYVEEAAERLRKLLQVSRVLTVNSGTAAMHLASKAIQYIEPEIEYIVVPSCANTFAWNPWLYDGKYKLLPMDVDLETWNIDTNLLKYVMESDYCDKQAAVCIVHNLGAVVDVPNLRYELPDTLFVEDCCDCFLGSYANGKVGTQSLCGAFSFYGNGNVTAGEGGALVTNNEEVYAHLSRTRGKCFVEDPTLASILEYNYAMTNLHAAILCDQLERYDEMCIMKNVVHNTYREILADVENVSYQKNTEWLHNADWAFAVRIKNSLGPLEAREFLAERGVDSRPMYRAMSYYDHLKQYTKPKYEENARILSKEVVVLPSYPDLSSSAIEQICDAVKAYTQKCEMEMING
ncbi:MAG: hypothetical protein GF334_12525 [Candidatus Altiarchaeales archaeon]|nr:hypothetical protein [Candidatus Altiarchaeales archaeon]